MTNNLPACFTRLTDMDAAWTIPNPGERLKAVRKAAMNLKARIQGSGTAVCVRTCDISSLMYPARFGLSNAALSPAPNVVMRNRMQLVQTAHEGRLVNILVNPTDPDRSMETPFIGKQLARFGKTLTKVLKGKFVHGDVLSGLDALGVAPEDIDFIAFDHHHVQDVRGLLGTTVAEPGQQAPTAPLLPNARLIIQKEELRTFECMHPQQRYWYVRDGVAGVDPAKIIAVEGDYLVGGGFAIVRTPGHTAGNQSPAVNTDHGMWTISENGVAAECYAPEHSRIPGVRRYAREYELEVVLNGNTLESSPDQYTSMVLEKTLADPSATAPEFPQHFPSSELEASPIAPGIKPTFSHGHITHGAVAQKADFAGATRAA